MPEEEGAERRRPDWRDYLAFFIAILQTVGLPLLILVAVILATLAVVGVLH